MRRFETQALRAGELLRRIRTFAQRGSSNREYTLLVPVIQDVLEWMRTDIRCKDSSLNFYSPSPLLPEKISIFCERIEIEQILINLIVNAAAAAQSIPLLKGHHAIDIYIECDDSSNDKIHVVVADRGPGLPENFIEAAFSPFTTTRPNGLGLGLSICRTIATDLGGELTYEHRKGGGAMFILSLTRYDNEK
jgi:two-component system, LuxR family, sensor kinase FixL